MRAPRSPWSRPKAQTSETAQGTEERRSPEGPKRRQHTRSPPHPAPPPSGLPADLPDQKASTERDRTKSKALGHILEEMGKSRVLSSRISVLPSTASLQALCRRLNPFSLQGAGFWDVIGMPTAEGGPESGSGKCKGYFQSCTILPVVKQGAGKNYNSRSASQQRGGGTPPRPTSWAPRSAANVWGVSVHNQPDNQPQSRLFWRGEKAKSSSSFKSDLK